MPLLVLPTVGRARAEEEGGGTQHPFESPIRVLRAEDDEGLRRIWLGISKGLEQASLDRAGLDELGEDSEAFLEVLAAKMPPLVFILGPRAATLVGDRLDHVPRVYVDTAWIVNGEALPPAPIPTAPAAVVRGVFYPSRISKILRELFGERPRGRLSWRAGTEAQREQADALALAAGFEHRPSGEVDVLLHLRLRMGESYVPFETLRALATEAKTPLLTDDVDHWGRGAALFVLPDHDLLGRAAADVGRRLLREPGEKPRVHQVELHVDEVRVDLRAAQDQGLVLPVPFLAGADRLRDAPLLPARPGAPR